MTDKEYETQKRRVKKVWEKWFGPIGMGWWQIDRTWSRARDEDSPNTVGLTTSNWEYRTAEITFFLPACADLNDDQLEECVVHEFVHVIAMPIHDMRDDQARQITEHTVTSLARTIIWAREAGEKAAARAKRK